MNSDISSRYSDDFPNKFPFIFSNHQIRYFEIPHIWLQVVTRGYFYNFSLSLQNTKFKQRGFQLKHSPKQPCLTFPETQSPFQTASQSQQTPHQKKEQNIARGIPAPK